VISAGGQAVIILNQELRYQHGTGLGAAAFYDGGNVWENASELGLDLRHSVGFGLRYDSIVGLLRMDLAFPLNRRAGERSYQFWFGLGQPF
jgi:translocation and assembly module TamA